MVVGNGDFEGVRSPLTVTVRKFQSLRGDRRSPPVCGHSLRQQRILMMLGNGS